MSRPTPPLLLYRALLWLLTPYLIWRFIREGRQYQESDFARQRRGYGHPTFGERPLWLHAASVGELNAMLPLIEALHREQPTLPLLLTTNTASSGALARSKLPAGVVHAYLPLDWPDAMQRFLAAVQPRLGVIMETELWPNLYRLCSEGKTPLLIINGRISEKTLRAPGWLRRLYHDCLQRTERVLCRSELDRERFLRLGAEPSHCRVVGNIKFAALSSEPPAPIELGRDYVMAASSRDGEERLIVEAWQHAGRGELLVIAPRHPQRLETILSDLQPFGLDIAVRSRGEQPGPATRLYIADTFGELRAFMAGAQLVFMGGSLVAKGGHNILEPAALGKAVICGPHMENFLDESRILLEGKGMVQVASVGELAATLSELLESESKRRELGENAHATLAEHADVVERYLQVLRDYL
jgi:3-deoxy-D-manno-octulosonic-acid transferase